MFCIRMNIICPIGIILYCSWHARWPPCKTSIEGRKNCQKPSLKIIYKTAEYCFKKESDLVYNWSISLKYTILARWLVDNTLKDAVQPEGKLKWWCLQCILQN